MLTLGRFRSMTESYGADLARWPQEARADARALLSVSAEARALLEEARALDELIGTTQQREDGLLWQPGEQEAALGRVRAGVAARIATEAPRREFRWRWVGLVAGGACAVIVGLMVGGQYEPAPTGPGVLNQMLRPAVLEFLPD